MRWAAGIEYDGGAFLGWQRLRHGPSVQAAVEAALSHVADHPVTVTCAGRTDSGVHARCQVIHFDSLAQRDTRAWQLGGNARLPDAASLLWVQPVHADFSARYAARARRYCYRILNRLPRPALDRGQMTWERHPLDAEAMHVAAQALVGEHDFSAFRAIACQALHPRRHLQQISVTRHADEVRIEVRANAFLHHMVRNIVGSLLPVGRGQRSVDWVAELLHGRDRSVAGPTAASAGLAFVGPLYPLAWQLPAEVSSADCTV
jgi:tRNA pseudouridine38-40 synthase